ncbi:MAG: hypothetical protein AAF663_04455, partial [Planctomycetota bacterium]
TACIDSIEEFPVLTPRKTVHTLTRLSLTAAALPALMLPAAASSFVAPTTRSRGDTLTTFQHWDNFKEVVNVTPGVTDANPNGTAMLIETNGTGFITSTSNVYLFSTPVAFDVTVTVADVATPEPHDLTLVMQVSTQGSPIDTTSPRVNGIEPVDSSRISEGDPSIGGPPDLTWFLFNLPYPTSRTELQRPPV